MKAFLLFLSSIIACISFSVNAQETVISDSIQRQAFQIDISGNSLSGVLITRIDNDRILGSMINEFGVSALDFSFDRKKDKVKLVNVISFLNKWYIKLVLKNDIKYCLHVIYDTSYKEKKGYSVSRDDGKTIITNNKRHITYTFSSLPDLQIIEDETEG